MVARSRRTAIGGERGATVGSAARWIATTLRALTVAVLALHAAPGRTADPEAHPLEPVDLSSPRAVLAGFMEDLDQAWLAILRSRTERRPDEAEEARVAYLADRVLRRLDLSDVPPTARVEEGYDAATYLWEVLSRIELPPPTEIPDASAYPPGIAAEWRVPHTEITIVRPGEPGGKFRFSKDSVARAATFFKLVEHLPYRREVPIENPSYLRQIVGGTMVPTSVVRSLPAPLRAIVLGQAVWKLIAFAVLLLVVAVIVRGAGRLFRPGETASPARRYLGRIVAPAVLLALLPLAVYLTTEQINIVGDFAQWVKLAADTIGIIAGTWVAWLACLLLAEFFISSPRIGASSLNAQLLRLTGRIAGIVLGLTVVFIGANRIGLPLLGVLAGVGVGGLAVALAAQDSLKNLLGSLMIFMDRPYQPGQRIVVEGQDGFVEQIGLRSTRIRNLDGSLTTIPNEKMARLDIENIGERTFLRRFANLRLPIDTSPARMERAVEILHEILDGHEGMIPELPPRIYFNEFNPDSFNIFVMYWFTPPRRWQFHEFNQRVNLEILRRFEAEGISFALPASTMRLVTAAEATPAAGQAN
jgi:MscS family membrane protein